MNGEEIVTYVSEILLCAYFTVASHNVLTAHIYEKIHKITITIFL